MSWLFGKTFRLVSRSWQMYLVGFHARKLRHTLRKITRLIKAIASKNRADTAVPMTLPVSCSQLICALKAVAVAAIAAEANTSLVEWPS